MDKPVVFFIVVGIALVLALNYSGSSFLSRGPLATGPGRGFNASGGPVGVVSSQGADLSGGGNKDESKKLPPGTSPFKDEVRISYISSRNGSVDEEYATLSRSGSFSYGGKTDTKDIDLDGWTLENNDGLQVLIPYAVNIHSNYEKPAPIQLKAGDEVMIFSGQTTFGASFRENTCTGYLNEFYSFDLRLDESCPSFSRDELLRRKLKSVCVDLIVRAPRCRQLIIGYNESSAGEDCISFSREHLNYAGCLKDNKNSTDFFLNQWRVFLGRREKLWDSLHDRVILRDKNGLIADEYIY